jgi:hypothetical protein
MLEALSSVDMYRGYAMLIRYTGLPGHAFYHAGKFAVEGWSESVAREMHPDWNSKFRVLPAVALTFSSSHPSSYKPF